MFVNMYSVTTQSKKINNMSYRKNERVKTYARVHNKDSSLLNDWLNSFYDEW